MPARRKGETFTPLETVAIDTLRWYGELSAYQVRKRSLLRMGDGSQLPIMTYAGCTKLLKRLESKGVLVSRPGPKTHGSRQVLYRIAE